MTLTSQLSALESSGLIQLAQTQPEVEYHFRHALVQDAAYASLLKADRKHLHEKVGSILEQLYPEQLMELAPLLGHHFAEAGADEPAIKYLSLAGDVAAGRYANAEAIIHYTRAIEIARHSPHVELSAHLFSQRGRALELSGRFLEALASYDDMESFALEHGDRSMQLTALIARGTLRCAPTPVFDFALGPALAAQGLSLARELGNRRAEAAIYRNLMLLNNFAGNMSEAVQYGEYSLAIARELELREHIAFTLNDLYRPYASIGNYLQALAANDEARLFFRETNNLPMLADNLGRTARIAVALGDTDRALIASAEARQISDQIGNVWNQSFCRMFVGYVYFERGDVSLGIDTMNACIRLGAEAGFMMPQVATRADLGWYYGTLGAVDRGLELAHLALKHAEERIPTFRTWALACLTRLYILRDEIDKAEIILKKAYEVFTADWAQNAPYELALADAELAIAQHDHARAINVINELLKHLDQFKIRAFRADALTLNGRALIGLNQFDQACQALQAAQAEAEALGSRRVLWQILSLRSGIETQLGHPAEARALHDRASESVMYIAQHCPPDLRATFLNLPQVRTMRSEI